MIYWAPSDFILLFSNKKCMYLCWIKGDKPYSDRIKWKLDMQRGTLYRTQLDFILSHKHRICCDFNWTMWKRNKKVLAVGNCFTSNCLQKCKLIPAAHKSSNFSELTYNGGWNISYRALTSSLKTKTSDTKLLYILIIMKQNLMFA